MFTAQIAGNLNKFQALTAEWMIRCFSLQTRRNQRERAFRLLEESLELFQASGCSRDEAESLVGYVFGRPVGDVEVELGDVLLTLAALASAHDKYLDEAAAAVLNRAYDPNTIKRIVLKREGRVVPGDYSAE